VAWFVISIPVNLVRLLFVRSSPPTAGTP
jgi:hypothetical protein